MIKAVLGEIGVFLLWNVAIGLAILLLPPALGAVIALVLSGWLLFRYILRRGKSGQQRRWALLRIRPIAPAQLKWVAIGVPFVIAFSWALGEIYTRLVPVPPENFNTFGPLTSTMYGRLALAMLAVVIAPLVEEFFFRGLIQSRLERGLGATEASALPQRSLPAYISSPGYSLSISSWASRSAMPYTSRARSGRV